MAIVTPQALATVLFIDSQMVHYARLYLVSAAAHGLALVPAAGGDPEADLTAAVGGSTKHARDLVEGQRAIAYLHRKCQEGGIVRYSPMTRLALTYRPF